MVHELLLVTHAVIGELVLLSLIWIFVELLEPTKTRIYRARIGAAFAIAMSWLVFLVGGYYYVNAYGKQTKPLILAGPWPWGHEIFMEAKEHMFIFGPMLVTVVGAIVWVYREKLIENVGARRATLALVAVCALGALAMIGMGSLISISSRVR